jgi:3-oxoacyl-[acyl-carrier protein] reductase
MKTVLITGGATGIGKATARLFAEKGYLTLINYNKSEQSAIEFCENLYKNGYIAECYKADITCNKDVEKMFDIIYNKYKKIDVLVNNAGQSLIKEFTKTSEEEWDDIFAVNLKGAFLCAKQALKSMLKNNSGKIINVSSMWGITGSSFEVAYSASKAGLIGFTKALAKEVSPSGITVNTVAPGFILTEMNNDIDEDIKQKIKFETPLQRLGKAEDVAKAIYFLADSNADFITGETLNVNGGLII